MAKAQSTNIVPRRVDRIAKKAGAIIQVKSKLTDLAHDVIISARGAHEVSGFIIDVSSEGSVTLRHKRGAGSSKQVVSTFTKSQIISFLGEVGEFGQLLVDAYMPVQIIRGQTVKVKENEMICTDIQTGEITRVATNVAGYDVSAQVDEAVAAKKYDMPLPVEKKGKAEKSVKSDKAGKGKKGKKASDENF